DRWAEALIFCGLAWYYKNSWVLLLVVGALGASFLVSYARARGEALGARAADVGAMQRPERILYLRVGLALAPIAAAVFHFHPLPVIALALVAATSLWTSVRRTLMIYRQLEGERIPDYGTEYTTSSAVPASLSGPFDITTTKRGDSLQP